MRLKRSSPPGFVMEGEEHCKFQVTSRATGSRIVMEPLRASQSVFSSSDTAVETVPLSVEPLSPAVPSLVSHETGCASTAARCAGPQPGPSCELRVPPLSSRMSSHCCFWSQEDLGSTMPDPLLTTPHRRFQRCSPPPPFPSCIRQRATQLRDI